MTPTTRDDVPINLRFSRAELQELAQDANRLGYSRGAYVRLLVRLGKERAAEQPIQPKDDRVHARRFQRIDLEPIGPSGPSASPGSVLP